MMHAYPETYLNDAMNNLGNMFDYGLVDLHYDPERFYEQFLTSGVAKQFEQVNPKYVAGLSGPEPAKPAETPEAVAIEKFEEVVVVGYGPKEATPNNEPTFKVVDEMPKFPGGQEGLMRYLAKNIKYPTMAQQNKEQGKVLVQIVIGKDGNVSNIKILEGASAWLDAEAIRVVRGMPKWEPGKQNGQAVAVEYTFPITFRLQ